MGEYLHLYHKLAETDEENFSYYICTNNVEKAINCIGKNKPVSSIVYSCKTKLQKQGGDVFYERQNLFEEVIKVKAYDSLEYLAKNVKKINTRYTSDTPLTFAIKKRDVRACSILLEHGDVFLQLKTPDLEGKLPIEIARDRGCLEVVKLLESKYELMLNFLTDDDVKIPVEVKDEPVKEGEIECSICNENKVKVSFECGHCSCYICSQKMKDCWGCKKPIKNIRPVFF